MFPNNRSQFLYVKSHSTDTKWRRVESHLKATTDQTNRNTDQRSGGGGRGGRGGGRFDRRYQFKDTDDKDKDTDEREDKEGKQIQVIWTNASLSNPELTIYTVPAFINTIQTNSGRESQHLNVRVLFDSGALSRDLISQETVNRL